MESCNPKNLSGSNYTDICQYVKNIIACKFDSGFLSYFEWQYCGFDNRVVPTILMFFWFLVLLLGVATTADSFFAPCLVVVTRILRMSQNLAGVTLLALGNGSADVFSSLSAVLSSHDPNVGLALGSILGAGILVNTITAGVIMIISPFHVMRRPIIKDLIFYLLALLWCMLILIRKKIELWSSSMFLSLYVIYVLVTAISRAFFVKCRKPQKEEISMENVEVTVTETISCVSERSVKFKNEKSNKNNIKKKPVFTNENHIVFLNIPQYNEFNQNQSLTHAKLAGPSKVYLGAISNSFSRKQNDSNLNLSRMRSTSHRSIGSFAKIIINNEHQKEIMKKNSGSFKRKLVLKSDLCLKSQISTSLRRRTASLSEIHEAFSPKMRIRFFSTEDIPKSIMRKESNIFSDNAVKKLSEEISTKLNGMANQSIQHQSTDANMNEILQFSSIDESYPVRFPGIFKHFLLTILPVDLDDWVDQSLFKKSITVLQSPIMFILTMTIPVVDNDAFLKGWCKILNCLHCLLSPLICITFIHVNMDPIGTEGFLVTYLILIIGFLACVTVAITSKANSPPKYQPVFAFLGFVTSIFWIYEIVNEIVNVLTTFGVVLFIPQTILGLSILAFANSVGDLVSNITLARKGYPRIAYAACIGGPLFNLLVGIGLPFTIKTAQTSIEINLKSETIVLIFTILLITLMNVIALPLMKFYVKKCYGIILIVIYVLYFIMVIMFVTNVIHVTI